MQIARRLSSSTLFKRVFGAPKRSYAAAVGGAAAASDAAITKRRKTRVKIDERKAMVESYVNKYRAMNSGKFPSFTDAQKQVGGSYYVIKKFVQELEYQSRISTTSRRDENIQQKDITEVGKSADCSEVSSMKMTVQKKNRQDARTRDGTLLVKEAASGYKSVPDLEQVSGGQIIIDAETHEDTQKGKGTRLKNKVRRENESTEVGKVSRVQITVDAEIHKDARIQRAAQTSLGTGSANKNKSSTEVEEVLFSHTKIDVGIPDNAQTSAFSDVDSDLSKANDGLTSTCVEKTSLDKMARPSATGDTSEEIKVKSHQLKKEVVGFRSLSDKAEDNVKKETVTGDMLEGAPLKPEAEQLHQAEKSETFTRDLSKEHGDDTQPQKKSFMWENLKSLANGIVNIWRKF